MQASPGRVRTFSAGLADEASFDERKYAALAAKYFKTEHTEFSVKIDSAELACKLISAFDLPFGDSSALPTYLICEEAKKQVTVVLTGDGGDELFAGYDRFRAALLAEKLPEAAFLAGRLFSRVLPRTYGVFDLKKRLERFCYGKGLDPLSRHHSWLTVFNEEFLEKFACQKLAGFMKTAGEKERVLLSGLEGEGLLDKLLLLNIYSYLPDDLNMKTDRASMAVSLEARAPFLDTALTEYVFSLPEKYKVRKGISKYILRKAFGGFVPEEILNRRKHGFGAPVSGWFRKELAGIFKAKVLSVSSRSAEYVKKEDCENLLKEHLTGKADHGQKLWVLLQLELWLRTF